jgi:hypothetical protein
MISRMGWILASYATRPVILALTGVGILFFVLGLIPATIRPNVWWAYPGMPTARLMVDSQAMLDEVRSSGRQQEVDGMDLEKLWRDPARGKYTGPPTEAFYKILEEFPNLRILISSFESNEPTGIDQIVAVKSLEYLSLNSFGLYDLAPLASLRNLRRLDLQLMGSAKHVDGKWMMPEMKGMGALASLPKLDTLLLRRRFLINDAMLTEVGSLPHLSVLLLDQERPFPRTPVSPEIDRLPIGQPPTKAGYEALARALALRVLYVNGQSAEETALAKASAPRLWVFENSSATVQLGVLRAPFMVLLPCFCFAAAIGLQLPSQFLGPGDRLVPRFRASHALVAVVLAGGAIALGAARLMAVDELTVSAAIAVSAALVTSIMMMPTAFFSAGASGQRPKGIQHLTYILPILVLNSLGTPSLWGIRLNSIYAVIGYTLVACASTAMAIWNLSRLVDSSGGSGLSEPRDKMLRDVLRTGKSSPWMFATKRRDQQIEAWLSVAANSNWWRRVQGWRLGNPPLRILSFALATFALVVPSLLMMSRLGGVGLFNLVVVTCVLLIAPMAQVATMWRMRLLVLPSEFLRPYPRGAMQRELAAAFTLDLIPVAVLFAIIETIGVNLDDMRLDWRNVPLSFLIFLALGISWILSSTALFVVVRRVWIAIALVPALLLANAACVFGVVQLQRDLGDFLPSFMASELIQTQLWLPIASGAILCWILWRRWLSLEIGWRA